MRYEKIMIQTRQTEAELTLYLLDNYAEIEIDRIRPTVLICPGGGYSWLSMREAEPIAMQMLAQGFHAAVLRYHVAPYRFPTALAEVACMQPTYFIRRFKAAFGSTPIVHFNKLKIYKAMTLLSSTDYSLQKIAMEVGVSDAAYFSRMFKKHCDISPTEYRKMFAPRKNEF